LELLELLEMFCSISSAFIVGGARKVVIGQFSFCGVQGQMAERLKIDHLRQKDQAGSICQSIELPAVQIRAMIAGDR
jgi:hypothetical protein